MTQIDIDIEAPFILSPQQLQVWERLDPAERTVVLRFLDAMRGGENIHLGDRVSKVGGDYSFDGQVVSVFTKRSGKVRVVAENDEGILHIFAPHQLAHPA